MSTAVPTVRRASATRHRLSVVVAAAVALAACRPQPVVVPAPAAPPAVATASDSPWPGILQRAQALADAGQFADADRVLAAFAVSQPGSAEGAEADFWRALIRSDPANGEATVRDQLAAIDTYLNGGPTMPRYTEALILRRLVEAADSARSVVTAVRAAAQARERARGDELKRLSDELEKTLAELDRMRRRLAPRPPEMKPPATR